MGKTSYATPKSFRPIVLLNTLGKLIEKMIANQLQWDATKYGLLHPLQFGGVRGNSTEDAGSYITHAVRVGWQRGLKTSVVTIDFAQFFPSLNHGVLLGVLRQMGFATHLIRFFESYLVDRYTRYSHEGDLRIFSDEG